MDANCDWRVSDQCSLFECDLLDLSHSRAPSLLPEKNLIDRLSQTLPNPYMDSVIQTHISLTNDSEVIFEIIDSGSFGEMFCDFDDHSLMKGNYWLKNVMPDGMYPPL